MPSTIFVTEEYGRNSEFPNEIGTFPVLRETTYEVEGERTGKSHPSSAAQVPLSSKPPQSSLPSAEHTLHRTLPPHLQVKLHRNLVYSVGSTYQGKSRNRFFGLYL